MTCLRTGIVVLVIGLFSPVAAVSQKVTQPDVKGSKDHPLIPRYEGSYISSYEQRAFEEYHLPLGKFKGDQKKERLEGKYTKFLYYFPEERSTLEVMRNYEEALSKAGFKVLYSCALQDCIATYGNANTATLGAVHEKTSRYLAAKLSLPAGITYAAVHVDTGSVNLNVLETAAMEQKMVTIDAATMAGDISRKGSVSLYGIYFDTDKAELKPASDAALKEIVKLLKENPKLQLHVVGHTDNSGTFDHNMDLSKRRAEAVAKALVTKYGVAGTRLRAQGVGPVAPLATNRTEEGKALNRRVDLVEQ